MKFQLCYLQNKVIYPKCLCRLHFRIVTGKNALQFADIFKYILSWLYLRCYLHAVSAFRKFEKKSLFNIVMNTETFNENFLQIISYSKLSFKSF